MHRELNPQEPPAEVGAYPRDDAPPFNPEAPPPTMPARRVVAIVLIALVVGALLNAESLLETAKRQPFGTTRAVAVALAEPLVSVSRALRFTTPRSTLDSWIRDEPDLVLAEPEPPTDAAGVPTASEAATAPEPIPSPVTPSPSPPPAEPETLNGVARGPVTASDPLKLYIGGDSMVEIQFGTALQDLADDTGLIEVLAIDFDRGSGLSRPDFVDWPARLAGVSRDLAPDVMVVYFGGNDAQPLKIDGTVYEPEDAEWQTEYRARVGALMDQLSEAGHHVYWMGLPIPSSETMQIRFGILNTIYEEEAASREAISFVPMWNEFADANGNYAEYLPNQNGDVVDMRLNDGIHFTTAGAYRAARPTIARLIEDFAIGN